MSTVEPSFLCLQTKRFNNTARTYLELIQDILEKVGWSQDAIEIYLEDHEIPEWLETILMLNVRNVSEDMSYKSPQRSHSLLDKMWSHTQVLYDDSDSEFEEVDAVEWTYMEKTYLLVEYSNKVYDYKTEQFIGKKEGDQLNMYTFDSDDDE